MENSLYAQYAAEHAFLRPLTDRISMPEQEEVKQS